jgi:thiamine biosynthesis lipoprotein
MLNQLEFRAMGCDMFAAVEAESRPPLLSKTPEWFEEWEQVLSRFRHDSELTRFNQTHEIPVSVSAAFWEVFNAARKAEQMTNGLVTSTLLDAVINAGYDRSFDLLPLQAAAAAVPRQQTSHTLTAVPANAATHEITLPYGMSLDFGGAAKGWAAYQAMQRLKAAGPALIDAAGDIAISGPRMDGAPWTIGVANPFEPDGNIAILCVHTGGVATSGKDRRRWIQDGILQHHIINPATGKPAETDLLTVTVIAPDVMQAEAAAKAVFIMGSQPGLEWLEAQTAFAGLLVLENGQMLYSNGMKTYL